MKNVLIICDNIQEINRVRRYFGTEYKVRATNAIENAYSSIKAQTPDLAICHIGTDFSKLFGFYKNLRQSAATETLPLIVIADTGVLKALTDTVELKSTALIGSLITHENMQNVIESLIGE